MIWFDAHLDLACLAVNGRDMTAAPANAGGPWRPGAVTLPSLREGAVRVALATIFTEPAAPAGGAPPGADPAEYAAYAAKSAYQPGDAERAHAIGRAQLEVYLTWRDRGLVALDLPKLLRHDAHLGEVRGGMGVSETLAPTLERRLATASPRAPLHLGVLMENADPIRSPDELEWWSARGVVAIGMAWARASRYAAGNATPADEDRGLTDLGRALARRIDELGLVHDLSHLSDRACDHLLAHTSRPVMASHSNCRALLGDPAQQRHLRDETILEIARRGGVIGLNLFGRFLVPAGSAPGSRATIVQALDHVEHVCALAGHRRAVGLGSDMDGGFSSDDLPEGVRAPADLRRLIDGLSSRGWSDAEIQGFAHGNWTRFLGAALGPSITSPPRASR